MRKLLLSCTIVLFFCNIKADAQTTANVNWDYLDYLVSTGNYAGFVSDARTRVQRFAFGPSSVQIDVTTNITINGDDSLYTGQTNTYGGGANVSYATTTTAGSSTVKLTFTSAVTNLKFSVYDIDNNMRMNVAALNVATPITTTLSIATASGSLTTFNGNPGTNPRADGIATDYINTDNKGAVNVDVAGPVTSVLLTFSNAIGNFWLSDLQALVSGSFPTAYHGVSQPWPGQPSYMTVTPDTNLVQMVNPANGKVTTLFQEPAAMYVNALGYDPYNKQLFYVLDDTLSGLLQKGLKKYDFNTETISTVFTDVTTFNIPLFDGGVESASASYYNSAYYIGIEGGNTANTSNRESIIWRIEMDASNNPVSLCQAMALPADYAGKKTHDWGDFVISDGILYDWNSSILNGNYISYQYTMQTGAMVKYTPMTFIPKQNSVTWDEKIYQLSTIIRRYNGTTGYAATGFTMAGSGWPAGSGSGDAGEAFKPKGDFGDAPASYDPALSPAVHEMDSLLRLGATEDREWVKEGATVLADSDGADEDGVATVPLLCPCSGNFFIPVKVYNNTGANATLIAWLDYNGNGLFDAGEAQSAVVTSSAGLQTINLNWTTALTTLADGSITYLRVRVTSAGNSMTTANASGYFANGEVEDYRVVVSGFPLATNLISFTAVKGADQKAQIGWLATEDASLSQYILQKSSNGKDWTNIAMKKASGTTSTVRYAATDAAIQNGTIYYRLQIMDNNGNSKLSEVRQLTFGSTGEFTLAPNPAYKKTVLSIVAGTDEKTILSVTNAFGNLVQKQNVQLLKGKNRIEIAVEGLAAGVYSIQMTTDRGTVNQQFVKTN